MRTKDHFNLLDQAGAEKSLHDIPIAQFVGYQD
jgi:hypothetical protein